MIEIKPICKKLAEQWDCLVAKEFGQCRHFESKLALSKKRGNNRFQSGLEINNGKAVLQGRRGIQARL